MLILFEDTNKSESMGNNNSRGDISIIAGFVLTPNPSSHSERGAKQKGALCEGCLQV
jgi:hypothetical protein